MPGKIIRPELKPLTPKTKDYLLLNCESQPDEIILHYLQTNEIKLDELSKLSASRLDIITESYNSWLTEPDPAEINAWNAISPDLNNPFCDKDALYSKLIEFVRAFPASVHRAEADTNIAEIDRQREEEKWKPLLHEWETIVAMPEDTLTQMSAKESSMADFIRINQNMSGCKQELEDLKIRIALKELEGMRYDFDALMEVLRKNDPSTEIFKAADKYIWALLSEHLDKDMLRQFVRKVPASSHNDEAKEILNWLDRWEDAKRNQNDEDSQDPKQSDVIFQVWEFLDENRDRLPQTLKDEADDYLAMLKRKEMAYMEENPAAYPSRKMLGLINVGIINKRDLINRGLITEEALKVAQNHKKFIERNPIQVTFTDSELLRQDDITDVYLFGVPSTGKTCVLMGLLGSDLYNWNSAIAAGDYGNILSQYRDNHMLPERTLGQHFFCIHGHTTDRNGKTHLVNVIELAGEQFLDKIAMNPDCKLSLTDMDSIAAERLKNNNRKIFFIVIDPTAKEIKYEKKYHIKDDDGTVCEEKIEYWVGQKTVIKKMMDILTDPVNSGIMRNVDALHFIATKSDVIDHAGKDIKECVNEYTQSFKKARILCHPKNAQINEATGYEPKLYPFSLGKFYVGGAFDFDPEDSDKLMNVITENTLGIRDLNFIERWCDTILNYKIF